MREGGKVAIRAGSHGSLELELRRSKITGNARLIPYRELDEPLGLTHTAAEILAD